MTFELSNNSRYASYFDVRKQKFVEDPIEFLDTNQLSHLSFDAHLENSLQFTTRPDFYKPVIPNIYIIPPKTKWEYADGFSLKGTVCTGSQDSILSEKNFLEEISGYKRILSKQKIAIEISGGLDTALIYAYLRYINIEPLMIGIKYDRYEFRTENLIQNIFAKKSENFHMIDGDSSLVLTDLSKTKRHPLPTIASLYQRRNYYVSSVCKKFNITLLLNGDMGDGIFTPAINKNSDYQKSFDDSILNEDWINSNYFKKISALYFSPFALRRVAKAIWGLRANEIEDPQKIWARNYFKSHLPPQLSNYRYKASFNGLTAYAVKKNIEEISWMSNEVSRYYQDERLSPRAISELANDFAYLSPDRRLRFMASVSFINWIYALINEDVTH